MSQAESKLHLTQSVGFVMAEIGMKIHKNNMMGKYIALILCYMEKM